MGYIRDSIGDYCRALKGILGVKTRAHMQGGLLRGIRGEPARGPNACSDSSVEANARLSNSWGTSGNVYCVTI